MRQGKRQSTRGTGIVFTIVGIAMFVGAIVLYTGEQRFISTATKVNAAVTELRTSTDSKGNTNYSPVVQFMTLDNQSITYTSNTAQNPPAYAVGQKVDVYYDPKNPHSVVIAGQNNTLVLIFGGLGAVFAVLGVFILVRRIVFGAR